jgi:uncharacterized C2H2 Zn-finger protein
MAKEDIAELVEMYIRNLFEVEPKGRSRQPREEILEYHKQYYIKNKDKIRRPCECIYCGTAFSDKSAYTRHLKKSMKCKLRRAENRLAQLETNEANSIEAHSSSSSYAPPGTPVHDERDFLN